MDLIRIRRDTLLNWRLNNPTLTLGEIGIVMLDSSAVTNPIQFKVGTGKDNWKSLPMYVACSADAIATIKGIVATDTITVSDWDKIKDGSSTLGKTFLKQSDIVQKIESASALPVSSRAVYESEAKLQKEVQEYVSGSFENVVFTTGSQEISGQKTFEELYVTTDQQSDDAVLSRKSIVDLISSSSESLVDTVVALSESIDSTYYKSGSDAELSGLYVSGKTILKGDLIVSGTATYIHTEDLQVKDKYVEIASGSTSAAAADGAGIGIQGANVSFKYDYASDTMGLNKTLKANVSGNLEGTASNAVEAVIASYAKNVAADSELASLLSNANRTYIKINSYSEGSPGYLDLSDTGSMSLYLNTASVEDIKLELDTKSIGKTGGAEHVIYIAPRQSYSLVFSTEKGTVVIPSTITKNYIDGGNASNSQDPYSINVPSSTSISIKYINSGSFVLVTDTVLNKM